MRRWRMRVTAVPAVLSAAWALAMPAAAAPAAVTVLPAASEAGEAPSADGHRVVLEPESGPLPAAAPAFPAGVPFAPPPGRYELWLEGPGTVSPAPLLLDGSASAEPRPSVLALPLVPAGVVKLRARGPGTPAGELHVLHLDGHRRDPALRRPSRRRVSAAIAVSQGVRVPAGEVVAGLLDAGGELVGVAGPSRLGGGETIAVTPVPPARGTSDLVAIFDRPPGGGAADLGEADVEARLIAGGGEPVPPRVLVAGADRIYAMWLGVPSGPAEVTVRTPRARLDESWLRLRSGRAEIVRRPLAPLPSLEVAVRLPPEALALDPFVEVRGRPRPRVVASAAVAEETATLRFEHLPFEQVEALLKAGPWTWRETVDLTGGPEHRVRFEPWPIHVHGRVLRGDEPIAAGITFHLGSRERVLRVESDASGEYAATFLQPGRFGVTFEIPGASAPAHLRPGPPIEISGRVDLELPDNRVSVRVVETATGRALAGVELAVIWNNLGRGSGAFEVTTGAGGRVRLPPLEPSEVAVHVASPGLEADPVAVTVPAEPGFEEEIVVWVRRLAGDAAEAPAEPPG